MESYLRVNLLGPGPRFMKKRIYRAAVSQRLINTALYNINWLVYIPESESAYCAVGTEFLNLIKVITFFKP